jgi:hypothetical protein
LVNLVHTGTWQILGPALTEESSSAATWGFVLGARDIGLLVMSIVMYRVPLASRAVRQLPHAR